jgi:hypothetical protein
MKTIAITSFLGVAGLIAAGALALQWLDRAFGEVAVVTAVAFVVVMAFVVVIMAGLSLFTLAQSRIYAGTIRDTTDVNVANAKNFGRMLSASRGGNSSSREPELPMIDAEWWDASGQHQLPEPQPQSRLSGIGSTIRKMLPGSTETPMDHAMPIQRRERRQPAGAADWGDDNQEYGDRLIVS